jgi:hypothetical protein
MTLDEEIRLSNELCDGMQLLIFTKCKFVSGERKLLLSAHWTFAFELHRAILCLIAHRLSGAAQALVRTLIEVTIRSHVVIMGKDDDVKRILADDYKTNFKTIGKEIDEVFATGGLLDNFLTHAKEAMHSYTHAGMMQIGRRFSENSLKTDYPDSELIETIQVSTSAIYMVNGITLKYFGLAEEWQENTRLYVQWGNRGKTFKPEST